MGSFTQIFEQNPNIAAAVFNNVEEGLNQALPGSDFHTRYERVDEVGLALVVDHTARQSYNPLDSPGFEPVFRADNQQSRPEAWGSIAPEFLEGAVTDLGKFVFFALAKTENMRITGKSSSYDPTRIVITPGRVGFAGGRRMLDTFVTPSGLWEVHDHVAAGAFVKEVVDVAANIRQPRTSDEFAAYFEEEFAKVQALHEGVAAADLRHEDIGQLLPLIKL